MRPLDNARIFVVSVSVIEAREFLEVCGALVPLMGHAVEVLRFQSARELGKPSKEKLSLIHI